MPLRIGALLRVCCRRRPWQLPCWLLLLGLAGPVVPGQGQISEPVFRLLRPHARQAKVPFALQRNLIVVSVLLNGQGPYNFLLDTGLTVSLITDPEVGRELKLITAGRMMVSGAGEEQAVEAYQVPAVAVELDGHVGAARASFLMLSDDVLNISGYVGLPVHGLLGSDVFRNLVVRIDAEQQQLVFFNPDRYRAPRGRRWTNLPLELDGYKAYLTLPVQLTDSLQLPLRLVLDTGAGHALSVETTSDPRLHLPPARLRTQLGLGLNGTINGFLGRVQALQLGRYRVGTLLTSFPDSADVAGRAETFRNGNLGFELLKRFTTIIDYPHNRLLLRPNGQFRDPFEHDMVGFDLLAFGPNYRRYRLLRIEPGGPADQAGLQAGDEITSINLIPAEFFSLTDISRMLHSADGRQLLFVVRRPGTDDLQTARVRLTRQI